jgi:AbiTii
VNNAAKGDLLRLAESVSVDLLEEKKSMHDILVTCKQICKTLQISDENYWIELELNGYLVKYKTRDQLYDNLPNYRKTDWKFYDLYGNMISLPSDIEDLFGKSIIYHSVTELENSNQLVIGGQFFEKFNKFITDHGMDYASKNVRIHEAKVSKNEINQVLKGLKSRTQEFLDVVISILEFG